MTAPTRWVVIDCETSGLDPARDRLLSVGAVAVRGNRIALAECCGALVHQDAQHAPGNVLVHGITAAALRSGRPALEVIQDLGAFLGDGVPVGFHSDFDAAVLRRAGLKAPRRWLDLAALAPVLDPEAGRARRSLDDWLARYGIDAGSRHDALADAFATAQLLLVLLARAAREGADSPDRLAKLAGQRRWLGAS